MLSMMTAVELAPKSINALASLAALQARLTLFDEAWEAYRALGALDPERATTDLYTLGVQLLALDKLGLAAQAFGLTVQIRPDWAEAYALLGTVMIRTGALEGAAQVLEAALVLTPEDASVHNNLGIVYARMFELEKAQAHLRAALEAGPPAAGTHSWLGEVLRLEGRLDDSLAEHDAAIALDPAIPRLHARRAHTLLDMGKKGDAIEAIAAAEAIDAADGETLVVKATLLLAKKKTRPEAIDILMQVIAADPLDAGAHATLALALSKSKTTGARAKESIETALGIDPYLGKNPWVAALAKKLFK
jgi:tetratricopeptide (TPR) repeat protein